MKTVAVAFALSVIAGFTYVIDWATDDDRPAPRVVSHEVAPTRADVEELDFQLRRLNTQIRSEQTEMYDMKHKVEHMETR